MKSTRKPKPAEEIVGRIRRIYPSAAGIVVSPDRSSIAVLWSGQNRWELFAELSEEGWYPPLDVVYVDVEGWLTDGLVERTSSTGVPPEHQPVP